MTCYIYVVSAVTGRGAGEMRPRQTKCLNIIQSLCEVLEQTESKHR